MLPKRGRGRGRGTPRQEQETRPGHQRSYRDQPRSDQPQRDQPPTDRTALQQIRPPPGFFSPLPPPPGFFSPPPSSPSAEEFIHQDPIPSTFASFKQKRETRDVHPEELGIEIKHKLAITPAFPRRPQIGNLGRRIKLISNCFPIKIPSGYVFHYDVDILCKRRNSEAEGNGTANLPPGAVKQDKKYRCLSTKKNREIITLMLETNRYFENLYPAYDGQKNIYTREELIADFPLKCNVILPDENRGNPDDPRGPTQDIFEVTVKPVKKRDSESCAINLDSLHALFENKTSSVPQEAIMALETILRHGPCLKFTPIGRSFFYPPNPEELHPLGGGREIWFGYHQSLRLGQWKPLVNLDTTATTFYQKGPVLNYIAQFLNTTVENLRRRPQLYDADIKRMSKELKNMRIEVTHLRNYRRKYRIIRLKRENANNLEFTLNVRDRAEKTTVAAYFRDRHNINLQFPHLPCLQVNPENKEIYLPIEVCDMIEGQHCKKKLEESQSDAMIKFTALAPRDRFREITEIGNRANFNNDPCVRDFGLEVSREPLNLDGRVLDAPNVTYKNQRIKPKDGSWDLRGIEFFAGAAIMNWVLISLSPPRFCTDQHLNKFAKLLVDIGQKTGMQIGRPAYIDSYDNLRTDMKTLLWEMKDKYNADLVVIVVSSRSKNIYTSIKQAAETVVGLSTQCVLDTNIVKKCTPSLVSNLCQKINAKMGGVNSSLNPGETPDIMKKPVIIIGADVNHPSPSPDVKPSFAACVGSSDLLTSRYAVVCKPQTNIDESKKAIDIILDLKDMVKELLKQFYRHTKGQKPEKIIFYRDGVSEGQFEKVSAHEVKCVREACESVQEDYQPGITFIVVQKRHHTRFMPFDARDGSGRMKNIPPGTTVDTAVTHPLNFDFFLCSHLGLQGTSRPSHYTVIHDDNDFSANDLQKLTYYLCHTYVRCTKSISIPAPVAYAHLAAYRARQHYMAQMEESTCSSDTSTSGDYHALPQAVLDSIKVKDILKHSMYFV